MTQQTERDRVTEDLSAIPGLPRDELVERWTRAHGQPPPKGLSRRLLEYSAAYQAQVKAFGGLTPSIRRKLRGQLLSAEKLTNSGITSRKSSAVSSGTRLVREWHGTTHTVEVLGEGFLYDGGTYKSLSKIANVITGARWSGPRFFGL